MAERTFVASFDVSRDLYATTTWGADGKMEFYYDQFGQLRSRYEILQHNKKIPVSYTPAYLLGYMIRKLPYDLEDAVALLCIELRKHNYIK